MYLFAVNFDVSDVVFEHRGHVDLRELVLAEHDQETGLPTGSVSHYDQLFPDGCHNCTINATINRTPAARNDEQRATFSCVDTAPNQHPRRSIWLSATTLSDVADVYSQLVNSDVTNVSHFHEFHEKSESNGEPFSTTVYFRFGIADPSRRQA